MRITQFHHLSYNLLFLLLLSLTQVVEEDVPLPSSQHHSPEFVDLISQCLARDPNKRPPAEALMTHPFLQKVPPLPSVCTAHVYSLHCTSTSLYDDCFGKH